ncbi:CopG family transcriptional regulator [Azotobacter chroococcum]|uniref:ribbon-helix-helix domain-containing protein n=1 Tax=Azotobacter chroococcum TaxID=353 RepID=UPI0010402045|nr:CopG family transcriptional regulator [Azotobacter chroococcum]TBW33669.1 CopG family transcriptional regulator [Azotobacter chroococcum]
MAIIRKPTPSQEPTAETFIEGAPDGKGAKGGRGLKRGKKEQIAVIMAPDLLDQLDATAEKMGQSRSALISLAVFRFLNGGQ